MNRLHIRFNQWRRRRGHRVWSDVETLYALVYIERHLAGVGVGQDSYVMGRQASYDLTLEAMESRWPELLVHRTLMEADLIR